MNKMCSPYFEETFCKLLEKNPLIWDKNASDFKNKSKQKQAWKMISDTLNFPVDGLVRKYKSMREKYRREQIFEMNGDSSSERTPWPMKKHLEFLSKVIVPRKSQHFYCSSEEFPDYNEHSLSTDNLVINETQDPFIENVLTHDEVTIKNEHITKPNCNTQIEGEDLKQNDCNTPRGVKRKESTASNEAEDIIKSLNSIVDRFHEKINSTRDEGEFESFGKFVGNSLAAIEEDLADEATSEIMQVLIKYKKLHRRKLNNSL